MSAAKYLSIIKVNILPNSLEDLVGKWKNYITDNSNIYLNKENNELVEIKALDHYADALNSKELERIDKLKKDISVFLNSDLHHELLEFKESVVPQTSILPNSEYLQLRHIEVPLRVMDEYLDWRSQTIFQHVKSLQNVDSFVAYHSLFSTLPGVMFVCSFSCDPNEYLSGFSNEAYQEIVRQAGEKYIAGGKQGLYTKVYKKY